MDNQGSSTALLVIWWTETDGPDSDMADTAEEFFSICMHLCSGPSFAPADTPVEALYGFTDSAYA